MTKFIVIVKEYSNRATLGTGFNRLNFTPFGNLSVFFKIGCLWMNSELIFWSYNLRLRKKKWVREGHFSRPLFRLNASQGLYETHENWLAKVAVLGRTINRVCGCRNSAATVFTGQLNMSHRAEDADHFNYGQFLHIRREAVPSLAPGLHWMPQIGQITGQIALDGDTFHCDHPWRELWV